MLYSLFLNTAKASNFCQNYPNDYLSGNNYNILKNIHQNLLDNFLEIKTRFDLKQDYIFKYKKTKKIPQNLYKDSPEKYKKSKKLSNFYQPQTNDLYGNLFQNYQENPSCNSFGTFQHNYLQDINLPSTSGLQCNYQPENYSINSFQQINPDKHCDSLPLPSTSFGSPQFRNNEYFYQENCIKFENKDINFCSPTNSQSFYSAPLEIDLTSDDDIQELDTSTSNTLIEKQELFEAVYEQDLKFDDIQVDSESIFVLPKDEIYYQIMDLFNQCLTLEGLPFLFELRKLAPGEIKKIIEGKSCRGDLPESAFDLALVLKKDFESLKKLISKLSSNYY